MGNKKENSIISEASPHTIKKFEIIEQYVENWAQKLLNNSFCNKLVFIDCMCNSGEYVDENGKQVFGTPVRVTNVLLKTAEQYPNKKIEIFYNDKSAEKIDYLNSIIGGSSNNLILHTSVKDANLLLKEIAPQIVSGGHTNYLLVYDPYAATIDWSAIFPFINNWGEVIINHMLGDSIRAVKVAKSKDAVEKYESTYLTPLEELIPYGNDKNAYERKIELIINALRNTQKRNYYIASFPFFNSRNAIVYNLIHCTSSKIGFKLYKKVVWKVFEGKSSTKNTHGKEHQLMMDFENNGEIVSYSDKDCYYIKDVAVYLQKHFCGRTDVSLDAVWELLDEHPVFPSDGFRNEIKKELKNNHGAIITRNTISFANKD
jgi:hypothetical protein